MSTIMSSGTLEDRVSALTLLVQESPLHTMKAFENLLALAKKNSRNQALMALGALKDLLGQGVVLPPERKLHSFSKQPGVIGALQGRAGNWSSAQLPRLPGQIQKAHLISWAYEDWLKKKYFEILQILEGWCNDEVAYARSRAVTFVFELLREKPEQEENLLRLLLNKLGDTDKKIASRASYLLLQLQVTHPLMKSVIINAIQSEFIFRPGQSAHAKYYAIITLNQTVLSVKEQEVANTLLDIYFKLFVGLIAKIKPVEATDKLVNGKPQGGGSKGGKMAKKKALEKEKLALVEKEASDRLISQVLSGINRAFPFAKTDDEAFESNIDMIFKVTHSSNFNTSLQALMLLQQISATKHFSADRFYRTLYESLLDPRLLTSSKHIMYLNLLYRSLKADTNIKRVKAFVKRLLQIITLHDAPFVCGVLFLISELIITFPSIKSMLDSPENNDDDGEEKYVDAPEDGESVKEAAAEEEKTAEPLYNPRKRDPEYSNADRSCLWDVLPFPAHFHPSVSLFASRLLQSEEMPPKPDPTLHTLIHFLDRFAYRNPKANAVATKGASIMQPMVSADTADRLIKSRGAHSEARLNTEQFWAKKVEDVAPDEVFFHNYFNQASNKKTAKARKDKKGEKGGDSDDSGDEDEIWKALVNSKPEVEGGDDFDSDGDAEDLDELMSDDGGQDDEDDAEDGGVELNLDSDEDEELSGEDEAQPSSDDGFDATQLDDGDEAAFFGSDDELPSDFEGLGGEAEEEEEKEEEAPKKKSKRSEERKNKKKLKQLPTFASADDYAKLLENDDDEDY